MCSPFQGGAQLLLDLQSSAPCPSVGVHEDITSFCLPHCWDLDIFLLMLPSGEGYCSVWPPALPAKSLGVLQLHYGWLYSKATMWLYSNPGCSSPSLPGRSPVSPLLSPQLLVWMHLCLFVWTFVHVDLCECMCMHMYI